MVNPAAHGLRSWTACSPDATNAVCIILSVIPYIGRKFAKSMSGIEKYFIFFYFFLSFDASKMQICALILCSNGEGVPAEFMFQLTQIIITLAAA